MLSNANRHWQTIFLAATSAFIIESADCIMARCGVGMLILACRAAAVSAVITGMMLFAASYVYLGRRRWIQFGLIALCLAPLAVSSGIHTASTATMTGIAPRQYLVSILVTIFTLFYSSFYFLLTSIQKIDLRNWVLRLTLNSSYWLLAFGLFFLATRLQKLHYPLALSALFFCWLNLQIAGRLLVPKLSASIARAGVGAIVAMGIAMAFYPVSLKDTFAASDQGMLARDLPALGREHTMEDLVQHTPVLTPVVKGTAPSSYQLPHLPGKSVVIISVDALRPDHLSFNGYGRPTSPNMDALLRQSVVFDNAYAVAPTSSFSIPSIHAGMPMEEHLKSAAPLPPLLATQFAKMGYRTIGLYPPKVFSMGPALMRNIKKEKFGFQQIELLAMDAKKDVQTVLHHLRNHDSKTPLFLWIHFYDPHLPYSCHRAPFGFEQIDCYDAEIAWLDHHIGPLIDEIDTRLSNPIIVFTADHGEAFGEHGRFYHSTDLYDEQIRIPLAFRVEGVPGKHVTAPVSNCQLSDTLLSLVQTDHLRFKNDLRPHLVSSPPGIPVMSLIGTRRALISSDFKLMCEKWPSGACALFNLHSDPGEKTNIAAQNVSKTVEMLGLLKSISEREMERLRKTAPNAIILGRLKRPDAVKGLIQIARDTSSPFTVEATKLLALLKDQSVEAELQSLSNSNTGAVAAWATVGVALLEKTFNHDTLYPFLEMDTTLGNWCSIALGRNGDNLAFRPLLRILKHDEPEFRAQAALALGRLGNTDAVPSLISLLQLKQSRWAAIDALGALGDDRALSVLYQLKKNEPDISNLPRYEKAIKRIERN